MTFDPVWEEIHSTRPWGTQTELIFAEFLKEYFSKDKLFLDIGCGTGAATQAIAQLGYRVIAVDGSESAIKKLDKSLEMLGLSQLVTTKVADIMDLSFDPNTFDCITDISCLSQISLDEGIEFIKRAKTWLKPSGMMFSRLACEPYDQSLLDCWATKISDGTTVKLWSYGTRMTTKEMLPTMFEGLVCSYDKLMANLVDGRQAAHFYVVARKIPGL